MIFVCSFSALHGNSNSFPPCEEFYGFSPHPNHLPTSFYLLLGIHLTPIPEEIFLGSHQVSVPVWADHFPGLLQAEHGIFHRTAKLLYFLNYYFSFLIFILNYFSKGTGKVNIWSPCSSENEFIFAMTEL